MNSRLTVYRFLYSCAAQVVGEYEACQQMRRCGGDWLKARERRCPRREGDLFLFG